VAKASAVAAVPALAVAAAVTLTDPLLRIVSLTAPTPETITVTGDAPAKKDHQGLVKGDEGIGRPPVLLAAAVEELPQAVLAALLETLQAGSPTQERNGGAVAPDRVGTKTAEVPRFIAKLFTES